MDELDFEIDSLEGIAEEHKALYAPPETEGGKYRLKVRGIPDSSETIKQLEARINTMDSALKKANDEAGKFRHELKGWKELGELDTVKDSLEQHKILLAKGEGEQDVDKLLANAREEWRAERDKTLAAKDQEYQAKLQEQTALVEQMQLDSIARDIGDVGLKVASEAGVLPEAYDDVRERVVKHARMDATGGLFIVDKDGNEIPGATVNDYVGETLRKERPYLFGGSDAGGTGEKESPKRPSNSNQVMQDYQNALKSGDALGAIRAANQMGSGQQ